MNHSARKKKNWLDRIAISMAVICGIHCLVTPVLLVALPILATTFWVDKNFHLWMLLLVLPTTTLAVWSGCRQHKDKWVIAAATLGLGILVTALIAERIVHHHAQGSEWSAHESVALTENANAEAHSPEGGCCALHPPHPDSAKGNSTTGTMAASVPWHAILNTIGGAFLVAGHTRNFILCRRADCSCS